MAAVTAPQESPHAPAAAELACLVRCGQHEVVHAGRSGRRRRMLGPPPVW